MNNRQKVRNQQLVGSWIKAFGFSLIWTFVFSLFITFLIGCGEKEDKHLINVWNIVREGKIDLKRDLIRSELTTVLKKTPDAVEAQCPLKALDIVENRSDRKKLTSEIIALIKPLKDEIDKKEAIDRELLTDKDKKELERLSRKWNSALVTTVAILVSNTDWVSDTGDEGISMLIELLNVSEPGLQDKLIGIIVSNKDMSFEHLLRALEHKDSVIRRQAVIALGKIGDARAVNSLGKLISDKDYSVRLYLATALKSIGGNEALVYLRLLLKDESSQVRFSAANILGDLKDENAIDDLIQLLADDNSYVKSSAINAIAKIGSPAVPKLLDILKTGAANIKLLPSDYTGDKIGNYYKRELTKRVNIQASAMQILSTMKEVSAIPMLITAIKLEPDKSASEFEKSNAASLRSSAVSALIAIGAPVVEQLIRILEDQNQPEIARVNAETILSAIGDKRAVLPLINALKDANKNVRAGAATALGILKDKRSIQPLIEAVRDPDIETRTNSVISLGLLADKSATPVLLSIINDKNEREKTRVAAIDSVGLIKDTSALSTLVKVLIDEYEKDSTRKSAASALRSIENSYPSEAFVELLQGKIVQGIYMPKTGTVLRWLESENGKDLIKDVSPVLEIGIGNMRNTIMAPISGRLVKIYVKDGQSANAGELIGLMSYKDEKIKEEERSSMRNMSALALGKVKGDKAVPALIEALRKDKNGAVRKNAAQSLREIENAKSREALLDALRRDDSGVVRSECAYALGVGALKHANNVEPLIKTFRKDKYEAARRMAAWSLGEIADKRAVKPLIDAMVVGRKKGEPEAPAVIDQVITALDKIGAPAVQPLIEVLNDKDIDEVARGRAAKILGLIQSQDAVEHLIKSLKDESVVIRSESAKALGLIGDRRAVEPLLEVLRDPNEWVTVRVNAINSLGSIKDERAIDQLLKELDSNVPVIRSSAVSALGLIKDKRAVDKLIQISENPKEDDSIRANAITQLANIGDSKSIPTLVSSLKSSNISIRQNAIDACGTMAVREAVDHLISVVKDPNEQITLRAKALEALGNIGDSKAIPVISAIVANINESDTVWTKAAEALGRLRANQVPELAEIRATDAWEPTTVRTAAMMAISATGKESHLSILLELLNDSTVAIRSGAALALGNSKRREVIKPLIEKLQKDGEEVVRRDSAKALGMIADPSAEPALIKAFMEDSTASVKNESAIALGKINGKDGILALISVVQDNSKADDHRYNSIIALGDANRTEAIPALKIALESNVGNIHFEAAEALRKITKTKYGYER